MVRATFFVACLYFSVQTYAQQPTMVVYGTVRDFATRDSIPFPSVQIHDSLSDMPPTPVVSTARGRYELELGQEGLYQILFGAPGKVSKSVQIDTRGPSQAEWEGGFGMNIEIVLMDSLPGVDYSVLREPFGRAAWEKGSSTFAWDVEYTKAQSAALKALVDAYNAMKSRTAVPRKQ